MKIKKTLQLSWNLLTQVILKKWEIWLINSLKIYIISGFTWKLKKSYLKSKRKGLLNQSTFSWHQMKSKTFHPNGFVYTILISFLRSQLCFVQCSDVLKATSFKNTQNCVNICAVIWPYEHLNVKSVIKVSKCLSTSYIIKLRMTSPKMKFLFACFKVVANNSGRSGF